MNKVGSSPPSLSNPSALRQSDASSKSPRAEAASVNQGSAELHAANNRRGRQIGKRGSRSRSPSRPVSERLDDAKRDNATKKSVENGRKLPAK